MAPSDGCDRAHQDIREKTLGIERDLESVQRLLEAITNILRDNLVTLSGHDKAAQDMRGFLVGIAKDLQERMIHLEGAMTGWADFQDGLESAFAKLSRIETELMQMYGLENSGRTPNPLSLQIQESVQILRVLADRDVSTGRPLSGLDFWQKKLGHVLQTAVAIAIVAAGWTVLKPYLAMAFGGPAR